MSVPVFLLALLVSVVTVLPELSLVLPLFPLLLQLHRQNAKAPIKRSRLIVSIFVEKFHSISKPITATFQPAAFIQQTM